MYKGNTTFMGRKMGEKPLVIAKSLFLPDKYFQELGFMEKKSY